MNKIRVIMVFTIAFMLAPPVMAEPPSDISQSQITQLPISQLQKNILLSGQVYIGATHDVITLSLGMPRFVTGHIENKNLIEVWGYHFENDGRPTLLELHNGALKTAYRSSYADINERYGSIMMH